MIAHMFGPIEGRQHDAFMLGVSGLSAKLQRFVRPNGKSYIIYGDPAYGIIQNITAPFHQAHLTDDEQEFNTRKSKVQTFVNGVLTKSAKIYYLVSCILINCHTCLYGSQSTTYLI